jgi:Ni/Co efflux regulator RcnB
MKRIVLAVVALVLLLAATAQAQGRNYIVDSLVEDIERKKILDDIYEREKDLERERARLQQQQRRGRIVCVQHGPYTYCSYR